VGWGWSVAHTHKKNKMVTRLKGHRLCRRVRVAAEVVLRLSTRRPERCLRKSLNPILTGEGVYKGQPRRGFYGKNKIKLKSKQLKISGRENKGMKGYLKQTDRVAAEGHPDITPQIRGRNTAPVEAHRHSTNQPSATSRDGENPPQLCFAGLDETRDDIGASASDLLRFRLFKCLAQELGRFSEYRDPET
jgi:hypothetical protein